MQYGFDAETGKSWSLLGLTIPTALTPRKVYAVAGNGMTSVYSFVVTDSKLTRCVCARLCPREPCFRYGEVIGAETF